jgi:hypothetical protein
VLLVAFAFLLGGGIGGGVGGALVAQERSKYASRKCPEREHTYRKIFATDFLQTSANSNFHSASRNVHSNNRHRRMSSRQ